jgi:uncharacterized coiled-coil protein SlyX
MGHDTGLRKPYTKLTAEDILEGNDKLIGYVGAINALTINSDFILKSRITELEQRNNEVEQLRQELSDMQISQKEVLDLLKNPSALLKMIQEE